VRVHFFGTVTCLCRDAEFSLGLLLHIAACVPASGACPLRQLRVVDTRDLSIHLFDFLRAPAWVWRAVWKEEGEWGEGGGWGETGLDGTSRTTR